MTTTTTTAAASRNEKAEQILKANSAPTFAILQASADEQTNAAIVKAIGHGPAIDRAVAEYKSTPTADLLVLTAIRVEAAPVFGQANCSGSKVTMGSTSVTGDFRHELGHAIHNSLTPALVDFVKALHAASIARSKANPLGYHTKQSHEWYEVNLGIIGRRALDSWRENFAEHYRGYQKAVWQVRTGSDPEALNRYATRFPEWSRFWDAYYGATL
jgi:hypothetical protein